MTAPLASRALATAPLAGALATPNAAGLREAVYVMECTVYDPALAGTRTIRASTHAFVTAPTDSPAHTVLDGRLTGPGDVTRTLGDGLIPGPRATVAFGELVLANPDGALDAYGDYGWGGRTVTVRRGPLGGAYPYDFPVDFVAECEAVTVTRRAVRLRLRDGRRALETPLQRTTYAGDNVPPDGLEGGADIGGTPKPLVYGRVRNVPLVPVNTQKLIYQVSDAQASVRAVRDAGVNVGFVPKLAVAQAAAMLTVAFGGIRWLATGINGVVYTSADATTWTQGNTPEPVLYFAAAAVMGDGVTNGVPTYAVGGYGGRVYTTDTPAGAWTLRCSGAVNPTTHFQSGTVVGLVWARGIGLAGISTSPDLIVSDATASPWGVAGRTYAPGDPPQSICFAEDLRMLCVVGENGMILTSKTGFTADWTTQASGTTEHLRHVHRGGGLFVATGDTGTILTSPDGETWTARTAPTTTSIATGTYVANSHVLGCWSASESLIQSTDGDTWDLVGAPVDVLSLATDGTRLAAIHRWNGDIYVSPPPVTYASAADLEDDTLAPPPGGSGVYSAAGGTYVRLGAQPAGQLTADLVHGATAADRTAAQLMLDVLAEAGYTASDYALADFTALDAAASAECGLRLTTETAADALDRLADSVGAWWGFDQTGTLRVQQFTAPGGTPRLTITDNDLLDFDQLAVGQPSTSTTLRYSRNYAVQRDGLAGSVSPARRAELGREWQSVVASTPAVATAYPLAETTTEDTALADGTGALAEATRRQTLRGTLRRRYTATLALTDATAALALGDVVQVTSARFGLAGGVLLRVTALETQRAQRRLRLTLYR